MAAAPLGTDAERARVRADLERAAAWARAHGRPFFLGEFGTLDTADLAARAAWTTLVRSEARTARHRLGLLGLRHRLRGLSTSGGNAWRAPLRQALLG